MGFGCRCRHVKLAQPHGTSNEVGFSLCRTPQGVLMRGPVATGSPARVHIPVKCPAGSQMIGLYHTHPGGTTRPSAMDLATARTLGVRVLCIQNNTEMVCHTIS